MADTLQDNFSHDDGQSRGMAFCKDLLERGWTLQVLDKGRHQLNYNEVKDVYRPEGPTPANLLVEVCRAFHCEVILPLFSSRGAQDTSWEKSIAEMAARLIKMADVDHSLASSEWGEGWIKGFIAEIKRRHQIRTTSELR